MRLMLTQIEKEVSKGINLCDIEHLGIKNYALTKEQAIVVISLCQKENIGILGGDVFQMFDDELEITYDGWYCNRDKGETTEDFASRSTNYARKYLQYFKGDKFYFALTFG